MPRTSQVIYASTLALSVSGCLVPNIMCFHKTYRLSASMLGSTPLNADLNPAPPSLSCTSATDGTGLALYLIPIHEVVTRHVSPSSAAA